MTNTALLVGSDYLGTDNQLNGCGNDVRDISQILKAGDFNTTILTDAENLQYSNGKAVPVAGLPTKDKIQTALKTMIGNAKSGDTVIFYYSGHGTQIPKRLGGSEEDFIVPLDAVTNGFDQNKLISSTDLHNMLIQVPQGVKLLMVADSCFSGNITKFDVTAKGLKVTHSVAPFSHLRALIDGHHRSTDSHGALTLIAGCKATQESADLGSNGALTGAIKEDIAKTTVTRWLSDCWNYVNGGKTLSALKKRLTKIIKDEGVTDQDPQISYDKDTGIAPAMVAAPTTPATHVHQRISAFIDFLQHQIHHVPESESKDALFTQQTLVPASKLLTKRSKTEVHSHENDAKRRKTETPSSKTPSKTKPRQHAH